MMRVYALTVSMPSTFGLHTLMGYDLNKCHLITDFYQTKLLYSYLLKFHRLKNTNNDNTTLFRILISGLLI